VIVILIWCACWEADGLETFAVDDARAGFVVFLFGDPHLLEGGQGGQDGTADPHGVFTFGRGDDLDLDRAGGQRGDLLLHSVGDTRVHGGAAGKHGVGVQVLPDVHVALHDRIVHGLVDTARFHSQERRLEQRFRATEPFVTDSDHLPVGQLVGFLQRGGRGGRGHFLFEVQSDVA